MLRDRQYLPSAERPPAGDVAIDKHCLSELIYRVNVALRDLLENVLRVIFRMEMPSTWT